MSPVINSRWLRAVGAAAIGVAVVAACGPFFGTEALSNRKVTLLAPATVSFERELRALAPKPQDELPVVESGEKLALTAVQFESKELAPDLLDHVVKMRTEMSGDAAYALGDGLAPAVRDYTAGAVSFVHGDTDGARTHFQAVLALPGAEQRRSRELWTHFMLGRLAGKRGDQEDATKEFEATRAVVRNGMPDPLGLALASYGEEAGSAWQQGQIARAVELYATQAAYKSDNALRSLLIVANRILKDKDLLDKGIQDDRIRRLLFISVNANRGRDFFVGPTSERDDKGDLKPLPPKGQSNVDQIVLALDRHQIKKVAGAGLLAAAAYNEGRFDVAQRMALLEDAPLSLWVQGKLALRKGKQDVALAAFEKALQGFEEIQNGSTPELWDLRANAGILQVSRGDYAQALDLFYANATKTWGQELEEDYPRKTFGDYWGDVAYLAERVLTTNELREYIDHHLTATPADAAGKTNNQGTRSRLKSILARRLMRAERRSEALRYFDDPEIRAAAQAYGKNLDETKSAWRPGFLKAQAWFRAAKIAREHGMEILGFERDPDWAMWEGLYEPDDEESADSQATEKPVQTKDPFESDDESARADASRPAYDTRFQYRMTAVDEAGKAADALPVKSQAYAAVLCTASSWVIDREPERAEKVYQRYLKNGAYVKWAAGFARTCPAPNFEVDSVYGISRQVKHFTQHVKAHPLGTALAGVGGIGMLCAAIYFGWVRTRRAAV